MSLVSSSMDYSPAGGVAFELPTPLEADHRRSLEEKQPASIPRLRLRREAASCMPHPALG